LELLTDIPFTLDRKAFFERVRLPQGSEDAKDLEKLLESVLPVVRPKAVYDVCYIEARDADVMRVGGTVFRSRVLSVNLRGIERVFPYVATCGREMDELPPPPTSFLAPFWLDALKSFALAAARNYLREHVSRRYATGELSSMAPGSGPEGTWPIEQQKELFSIFGDVESLIGVRLTDSFLMIPNKSVSGILFPKKIRFQTCQICPRAHCPSRVAPYDPKTADSLHRG